MLFNRRRQSQDRLLRQDLLSEAAGGPLWMSPYSREQFSDPPEMVRAAEDFPRRAGPGELCFFEDLDPALWLAEAEEVVLYHWNRTYPSDRRFPLPLAGGLWRGGRSSPGPAMRRSQRRCTAGEGEETE